MVGGSNDITPSTLLAAPERVVREEERDVGKTTTQIDLSFSCLPPPLPLPVSHGSSRRIPRCAERS